MFSGKQSSKLDVLESKFNIYESLSKEMLEKLETAVDKISESNQRIANILAKHDERLDQSNKTDQLMINMINEVKENNTKEHLSVIERIRSVEKSVDDLIKFRWQTATVAAIFVIVLGALSAIIPPFIDNLLPNNYNRGSHTTTLK